MNLLKLLQRISSVGIAITLLGELLMKVGSALSPANLASGSQNPSADRSDMSQDPSTLGVRDEKPGEERQRDFFR